MLRLAYLPKFATHQRAGLAEDSVSQAREDAKRQAARAEMREAELHKAHESERALARGTSASTFVP
jgi:hypothetical protein